MSRARFALEVAAAALLPWRAARTIRELRRDIRVMILTTNRLLGDDQAPPPPQRHLYLVK